MLKHESINYGYIVVPIIMKNGELVCCKKKKHTSRLCEVIMMTQSVWGVVQLDTISGIKPVTRCNILVQSDTTWMKIDSKLTCIHMSTIFITMFNVIIGDVNSRPERVKHSVKTAYIRSVSRSIAIENLINNLFIGFGSALLKDPKAEHRRRTPALRSLRTK